MKNILTLSIPLLAVIIAAVGINFASCKTFKPEYKPVDDECAIYYDTLRYYSVTTSADAAIIGQWSEFCKDRIKDRRKEENKR